MSEGASPEPGPYATVLVAVLKAPRDLEIAREQHWYRIPVKKLPTRAVGAPIVAFYQPGAFRDERWAIHYYALAERWAEVRRVDLLPEEPDHPRAQEPYYKVQLGPLQALPHPIESRRWRRVTFIVTHWQRLQEVEAVEDLLHGSALEESLWQAMRRLGYLAEHALREARARFVAGGGDERG